MLKISKPSADRLDIELSGSLDADAMRAGLDAITTQSKDITNGKMLYTIMDFEFPTLSALAVEFYRMPSLFGLIRKFDKCAVLSDTSWIRTAAEVEGAVIPSLKIKSFPRSDSKAAIAWLYDDQKPESDEEDNFPV